jgi:hypothetical protein
MVCQYCNKRLGIIQRLKGQSFCSLEHQELHFGLSFERLRDSVTEITPNKIEPRQSRHKPDWMIAKEEQSKTAPAPQAEQMVALPASEAAKEASPALEAPVTLEASPTLEIASLVEAVGTSTGVDLPEAPFLHELPAHQDQPASPLKSYAEALVSAAVQLPVSPTQKVPLRASPSRVLDILPARPPVEITPVASQPTFRSVPQVPQGYPPVVVSASATLLLDSKDAKLLPLPLGEPFRGKGPVPLTQSDAIETPVRQPRLLTRQADPLPTSAFERPPQAPACDPLWKGRLGRGPALPLQTGVLRPQRDVVRLVPPAGHGNLGPLASFQHFAEEPEIPVQPKELVAVAPAAHFPADIALRPAMFTQNVPSRSSALALAGASTPLAVDAISPLRYEPSFSQVDSTWLPTAIVSQLPEATVVPGPGPIGLSLAEDPVPVACSSAASFPPAVEPAPAAASALPFLLLSRPSSSAVPAMPLWSSTRPLLREPSRLPASGSELQSALSAANLQPSSPSPMSLVTWSHSLSVSIPARNPSNLGGPAPIGMSAHQGRPQALRPWSPGRRVHRITPLLPQPSAALWAPEAPMQASLRPPVIKPIRPGSAGTAPPHLTGVRVQPASMPVLPPAEAPFGIEPVEGLAVPGLSPEAGLKLASTDLAHNTEKMASELRPESSPVLPSFSARRQAPAIRLAPWSHRFWWDAVPPAQNVSKLEPFSELQRLAWSLTASLPRPDLGLTEPQGLAALLTPDSH